MSLYSTFFYRLVDLNRHNILSNLFHIEIGEFYRMATTWKAVAASFKAGIKITFTPGCDLEYPKLTIPMGTIATVVQNSLNDVTGFIALKPDDPELQLQLKESGGFIILIPKSWNTESPISLTGNRGLLS